MGQEVGGHGEASRKEIFSGPVDQAMVALGLRRAIRVAVPGFPDAMRLARQSDLVALVPRSCLGNGRAIDREAGEALQPFELPVRTPEITNSAMWHPRLDADLAHRWLRDTVTAVCCRQPARS